MIDTLSSSTQVSNAFTHATCIICRKHDYVAPLHGGRGGPLCCLICAGEWHAKHSRLRRLGRVVVRAIAAYVDAGGQPRDIDALVATATARDLGFAFGFDLDPMGCAVDGSAGENIELTSELLADVIQLAHPDRHPPERLELAHRVTQELLALQPFVFPRPAPKPAAPSDTNSGQTETPSETRRRFTCTECAGTSPQYYCAACQAEWEKRCQKEHEQRAAKRRAWYERRKEQRLRAMRTTSCPTCGVALNGKRRDARYCSDRCRQRAHRLVTAKASYKANSI